MTEKSKRSSSKEEDERRQRAGVQSRLTKSHGGQLVEAVAPEELESMNDADCKHEKIVRDESETEFMAFICANPKCNEVFMYGER